MAISSGYKQKMSLQWHFVQLIFRYKDGYTHLPDSLHCTFLRKISFRFLFKSWPHLGANDTLNNF